MSSAMTSLELKDKLYLETHINNLYNEKRINMP